MKNERRVRPVPQYVVDTSDPQYPIACIIERKVMDDGKLLSFPRPVVILGSREEGALVSKSFDGANAFFASNVELLAGLAMYNLV